MSISSLRSTFCSLGTRCFIEISDKFCVCFFQSGASTLKRHLQRYHPKVFSAVETDDKLAKSKATVVKRPQGSASGSKMIQQKIDGFATVPYVTKLACDLAVVKGVSFSLFDHPATKEIMNLAQKGFYGTSSRINMNTINSENVKKSVRNIAEVQRLEIKKLLDRKIINLTADFATCERRSFLGKLFHITDKA